MPIRPVKQQSDRGSIKDLQNGDDDKFPPTPYELRLKSLYERGLATRDQALIDSLGLIAVNGTPKDPVSIFRHREYIKEIEARLGEKLEQTKQEIAGCFSYDESDQPRELRWSKYKQENSRNVILMADEQIKTASADHVESSPKRSFRRVS